MENPQIVQGGMGVGVSNWKLAREVSLTGNIGVVAGTAMDVIIARRLQDGDLDGSIRRALAHFPDPEIAGRILAEYYVEGGIKQKNCYKQVPMFTINPLKQLIELTIAANFAEIYLAKEGHNGLIGINLLGKIQLSNVYSIYGAILAGVDYVIMGAGIPLEIPGVLERLSQNNAVAVRLNVFNSGPDDKFELHFNPGEIIRESALPDLYRPRFFPIISSNVLAATMVKRASGRIDGLIYESYIAGGHNAPPRGKLELSDSGEPVYGIKDEVDIQGLKQYGLPFYLAGGYGNPAKHREALELGAAGTQIGTPFAFCEESGLAPEIKSNILQDILNGVSKVFTDPFASPTGFPFKVLSLIDSISEKIQFLNRPKICDLGYLRQIFKKDDGTVGYRCPSEPEKDYLKKNLNGDEIIGRKCLCNALMANIGIPRRQKSGYLEKPLITAGDYLKSVANLINSGKLAYTARDVINYILNKPEKAMGIR